MDDADKALVERLRKAVYILPFTSRDTPDYAEVLGEGFQAMSMDPAALLAFNELPTLIARIEALSAQSAELTMVAQRDALELMHTRRKVENQRDELAAKDKRIAELEAGLREIAETPNAGWMIARRILEQDNAN